jgi:hypothetical protein
MGLINPTRSNTGLQEGVGEVTEANALTTVINELNGNLDNSNLKSTAAITSEKFADADKLGLSVTGAVRRGAVSIPAAEATAATNYSPTNLATPDRVQNVVMPTNGLIAIWYQAIWQNTVATNARAAIFIGANQLKGAIGTGAPVVQDRAGPTETNDDAPLFTISNGLGIVPGVGATTEVTTGQIVGEDPGVTSALGGPVYVFAAAGTYDISIQFKNQAAGSLTVKNRHLWVMSIGF